MKEIGKSATRIVLLMVIATLCFSMALVVVKNADKTEVVTQIIGVFSMVAASAVTYYYKNNNSTAANEKITPQTVQESQNLNEEV